MLNKHLFDFNQTLALYILSNRGSNSMLYPNSNKTQASWKKVQKYLKYRIQKDIKNQTEVISHSKVINGKIMLGGVVEGGFLRTPGLNRVKLSLHDKGHVYL